MQRLQGQLAIALHKHGDRRHHAMEAAPGRHEIQLLHERAARVFRAPRARAPRRGQHHRPAPAARQAHLGLVPVADAGIVGATRAVDLRRPQEGQVHAAPRAQIVEILVRENRRRVLGQHRVRAGYRNTKSQS
ncbi:hypothetical protein G6F24_017311 [Rhizopus arrhizus]|nr:hypothetical protein G6F24_017311 [Rhizopus arrhizus]